MGVSERGWEMDLERRERVNKGMNNKAFLSCEGF